MTRTAVVRRGRLVAAVLAGLLPIGLSAPAPAEPPRPLTPAWLAARASGAASGATTAAQSAGNAAAVAQSLADMQKAATAIAALKPPQPAAATAAQPNGLVAGWLAPDPTQAWLNAAKPVQSQNGTRTTVTISQSKQTAVLYWQSFNVGAATGLVFDQSAGGTAANTWVAINRVTDPMAAPSTILGAISAPGQVYIINQNGIIFGPGSQVNTAALLATTVDFAAGPAYFANNAAAFQANGIYSQPAGTTGLLPAFAAAAGASPPGAVTVMPGAQITTLNPTSSESRGGFVLLMGSTVTNGGTINAPAGQVALAAGQAITVTQGYTTAGGTGDPLATTLGLQIAVNRGGTVTNSATGVLQSATGDVTMVGETVQQNGIALATTTTSQRGTIHLLTPLNDPQSSVTLGPGSVTLVLPDLTDPTTALNAQRAQLIATSATDNALRVGTVPVLNDVAGLADQLDESRIEISAGGSVTFQSNSLTMAQGGQIAVAVGSLAAVATGSGRIDTDSGAVLDVSGVPNVSLPMSANYFTVNIQSNELRDSPGNRIPQLLANANVTIDLRDLVLVPASTAYPSDRYYTEGGLLEVSGYLNDVGHTIGEWTSVGGTITLSAPQVVAGAGSVFNLAGGAINYQAGMVPQSWLIGSDGQLYNVATAPGTLTYAGLFTGFTTTSSRWGVTDTYGGGIATPSAVFEQGYTVGRDAGSLVLSTPTALFSATIDAGVVTGTQQTAARPSAVGDPFLLPQTTAPLAGSLALGKFNAGGLAGVFDTSVDLGAALPADAAGLSATDPLPADDIGTAWFPSGVLNHAMLGGMSVSVAGMVTVTAPIGFAPGATVGVVAPTIAIDANLTLPAGSLSLGNRLAAGGSTSFLTSAGSASGGSASAGSAGGGSVSGGSAGGGSASAGSASAGSVGVTLAAGTTIEAGGTWTNLLLDPSDTVGAGFANGGSVTIASSQGVSLLAGSLIDVSAGGILSAAGKLSGGQGGSISITADDPAAAAASLAPLVLQGSLAGFGASGAGTLQLTAPSVAIGNAAGPADPLTLVLPTAEFRRGFASYQIDGLTGLTVAPDTTLDVVAPSYQQAATAINLPTGGDPAEAYTLALAPLFTPNALTATMTTAARWKYRPYRAVQAASGLPVLVHLNGLAMVRLK